MQPVVCSLSISVTGELHLDMEIREVSPSPTLMVQYAFFRIVNRSEANDCFDETKIATGNGWMMAETLSSLGGFVVAKRCCGRSPLR
jgi:hypothetical protein